MEEELRREFEEYKAESELAKLELETLVAELELKLDEREKEFDEKTEKLSLRLKTAQTEGEQLEVQLNKSRKEMFDIKAKYEQSKRTIVTLENENDRLAEENRFKEEMMRDLQAKLETTLEQLTILQVETECIKEANEEIKIKAQHKIQEIQENLSHKKKNTVTKEAYVIVNQPNGGFTFRAIDTNKNHESRRVSDYPFDAVCVPVILAS